METVKDIHHWLKQYSINGVSVSKKELLYYRNKTALIDVSKGQQIHSAMSGRYLSKLKGRGMEFDEVRHYQPGDDVRMIDWRVTARAGSVHTKLFREEKERPVFILTDLSSNMQFGSQLLYKSVQACHLAALLSWRVIQQGDRLGGLVYQNEQHQELKPKARSTAALAYIHALEQLSQIQPAPSALENLMSDSLLRLSRLAKPGSLIIIISDFSGLNKSVEKTLNKLSRHCQLLGYRISDPLEHALPEKSIRQSLPVINGKTKGFLELGNPKHNSTYQTQSAQKFANQKAILNKSRVQLLDICAAKPLETQLK